LQSKIVVLTLLAYLLSGLGLGLEDHLPLLKGHLPGLGLGFGGIECAGLEPIRSGQVVA